MPKDLRTLAPRLFRLPAWAGCALLATITPAVAQTINLSCEQNDVATLSFGGREPLRYEIASIVNMTVDLGRQTVFIRTTGDDGKPVTAFRDLLVATPEQIVMCQADACQKELVTGQTTYTVSVTTIDLQTGELSRRVQESLPLPRDGGTRTLTAVRSGFCRKV